MLELELDTARKLQGLELENGQDVSSRRLSSSTPAQGSLKLNVEIEKDIQRLMGRISELEMRNSELQIKLRKQSLSDAGSNKDKGECRPFSSR